MHCIQDHIPPRTRGPSVKVTTRQAYPPRAKWHCQDRVKRRQSQPPTARWQCQDRVKRRQSQPPTVRWQCQDRVKRRQSHLYRKGIQSGGRSCAGGLAGGRIGVGRGTCQDLGHQRANCRLQPSSKGLSQFLKESLVLFRALQVPSSQEDPHWQSFGSCRTIGATCKAAIGDDFPVRAHAGPNIIHVHRQCTLCIE